jgi:hypothetical protein
MAATVVRKTDWKNFWRTLTTWETKLVELNKLDYGNHIGVN